MGKTSAALPDFLVTALANADKSKGFPDGTMLSLMQQEVGGNIDKFLQDPGAYHYPLNADGKRVAPQSGKQSSAFGPFGILESTAVDPGYKVTPLKNKSLDEQIRFAADYLAARSRAGGGLEAGLAGYGEGKAYANQVVSRVGGGRGSVNPEPVVAQSAPVATQVAVADPQPVVPVPAQADPAIQVAAAQPVYLGANDPKSNAWLAFQEGMNQAEKVNAGRAAPNAAVPTYSNPDFAAVVGPSPTNAFNVAPRPGRDRALSLLRQIGALG